jgi:hypothetical protein
MQNYSTQAILFHIPFFYIHNNVFDVNDDVIDIKASVSKHHLLFP